MGRGKFNRIGYQIGYQLLQQTGIGNHQNTGFGNGKPQMLLVALLTFGVKDPIEQILDWKNPGFRLYFSSLQFRYV